MSVLRCKHCGHDATDHADQDDPHHIEVPGKPFTCGECKVCYPPREAPR